VVQQARYVQSGFLILRFSIHVRADGAFRLWSGADAGLKTGVRY